MHRRGRHVRGGSCRREREPILDNKTNQAQPPSPSERRITVFHPGLRAVVSFDTHSLSAGPDLPTHIHNIPRHVN